MCQKRQHGSKAELARTAASGGKPDFCPPVGEPQQRGLARAGAADNGQKLALGDLSETSSPATTRPSSNVLPTCA